MKGECSRKISLLEVSFRVHEVEAGGWSVFIDPGSLYFSTAWAQGLKVKNRWAKLRKQIKKAILLTHSVTKL
jgi:hypothetical protein